MERKKLLDRIGLNRKRLIPVLAVGGLMAAGGGGGYITVNSIMKDINTKFANNAARIEMLERQVSGLDTQLKGLAEEFQTYKTEVEKDRSQLEQMRTEETAPRGNGFQIASNPLIISQLTSDTMPTPATKSEYVGARCDRSLVADVFKVNYPNNMGLESQLFLAYELVRGTRPNREDRGETAIYNGIGDINKNFLNQELPQDHKWAFTLGEDNAIYLFNDKTMAALYQIFNRDDKNGEYNGDCSLDTLDIYPFPIVEVEGKYYLIEINRNN